MIASVLGRSPAVNDALGEALALCAQDAGGNGAVARVVRRTWRKGRLFCFAAMGQERMPRYVIKLAPGQSSALKWDPQREFEGLRALEAGVPRGPGYGAVRAIGFGPSPRYVVMSYHRAPTLMRTITRAVRRPSDRQRMQRAMAGADLAGRWLGHFQRLHPVTGPTGSGRDGFVRRCLQYVGEIESRMGNGPGLRSCGRCIETAVAELDDQQAAELTGERVCHGDLVSSNILLDDEGVLTIIDAEAIGHHPVNRDLVAFRKSMRFCAGRGWGRAARVAPIWAAFWDAYVDDGGSAEVAALSCLRAALARLAGGRRRKGRWRWLYHWHSAIGRFDKARCAALEMRWLHGVRGGLAELRDHARNGL